MIIRPFTCFCATLAIASGFVLYTKKHQTALLDQKIVNIIHQTRHLQDQTDTLRTEWTLENQPDRLEQLAYRYAPYLHVMNPSQFVRLSDLEDHLPAPKGVTIQHKRHQDLTPLLASNHHTSHEIIAKSSITNHILKPSASSLPLLSKDMPSKNKESMSILISAITSNTASIKTPEFRILHPHQANLSHHTIVTAQNIKNITFPDTTAVPSSPSHTLHPHTLHRFSVPPHTHDFTTIDIPADIRHTSTPQSTPIVVANETQKPIRHSLPIAAATWHFVRKRKVIDQPQTESHTAYFRGSIFNHETKLLPPPVPILR